MALRPTSTTPLPDAPGAARAMAGCRSRWAATLSVLALLSPLVGGVAARASSIDEIDRLPPPRADSILVVKSEHRLYLLHGGAVVRSYTVRLGLNPVGPKRHEMDFRTPEGRYVIDGRNPNSRYFRALHVSYPNAEDRREAAAQRVRPGGDIMIHGLPNAPQKPLSYYQTQDWTNGCIALSNEDLLELWALVPTRVPVVIRP